MVTLTITSQTGNPFLIQSFPTAAQAAVGLLQIKANPLWVSTNIVTQTGEDDPAPTPPALPTAQQLAIMAGLRAQGVGAQALALVYSINEANLAAQTLSSAQFTAMMADANLALIERLLFNGSLQTALNMIRVLPSIYFTSANINTIEAFIVASGLAT
jgi:hypothetical protein